MATWAGKRKFMYGSIAAIVAIGGIGVPAFFLFYKAPTCFDGIQNGYETGVDCGGRCTLLCQSAFLAPSVAWTRIEQVAPDLYNAAAYIVNPNADGEAKNVPYHMALYDKDGIVITDQTGTVTLPPHRNTIAFMNAMSVGKRVPVKVLFEFTAEPNWTKQADTLTPIVVASKDYNEDANGSSLSVNLKNSGVTPLNNIDVYVILYDKDGNAVGFSKTVLDTIPALGMATAPFTWNRNRNGAVISIEVLYVAE